jgi:hypothetical protein
VLDANSLTVVPPVSTRVRICTAPFSSPTGAAFALPDVAATVPPSAA